MAQAVKVLMDLEIIIARAVMDFSFSITKREPRQFGLLMISKTQIRIVFHVAMKNKLKIIHCLYCGSDVGSGE